MKKIIALFLVVVSVLGTTTATEATAEVDQHAYIRMIAEQYELSPELIEAVIEVESGWNEKADNGTSVGLMQLNRNTYPWLAEQVGLQDADPYNWQDNVRMGIWYLDYLRDYWTAKGCTDEDTLYYMLISYNRGIAGCQKWLKSHELYDNYYSTKVIKAKYRIEQGVTWEALKGA